MDTPTGEPHHTRELADDIYEATRALAHANIAGGLMAPDVYAILGNLKLVAANLETITQQMIAGLPASLTAPGAQIYEDDGSDPVDAIATAVAHLRAAAPALDSAGENLAAAQNAIAQQGYRLSP